MNDFIAKVKQVLTDARWEQAEIDVSAHGSRVLATVTAPCFKDVGEAERQAMVWDVLQAGLAANDHALIDFVFVNAPAENTQVA